MKLLTLVDCEQALLQFVPPARSQRQKYTLTRMRAFMHFLGDPQNSYQVVHVAGTSGKTSTCYYAAALLQTTGLKKVGLTISPHITRVNERVQINLVPASEVLFTSELSLFLELVVDSKIELTYFEVLMAFAYWFFARQKVDIAVIETGLGGLLDASNVVTSPDKVCIITDIGFDHTGVLGTTLKSIATQKAGIIGTKNRVFTYRQASEIINVIRAAAIRMQADLHVKKPTRIDNASALPLFQQHNAVLAQHAIEWLLQNKYDKALPKDAVAQAALTLIPARMEIFKIQNMTVVVDGAHNPQKIKAFTKSFRYRYTDAHPTILFACIQGPDFKVEHNIAELLKLRPSKVIITTFQSLQDMQKVSVEPAVLVRKFAEVGFLETQIVIDPVEALDALLGFNQKLSIIVGSLYLVFELRSKLIRLADRQL